MTLALYKDELGGEPLWTETQSVEVDKEGRYTVLVGATLAEGLPVELFPSGEPRWLSVEIQGQPRQSRALLVGVPYALKALDSEKLGGKPASDFVSSANLSDQVRQVIQAQSEVSGQATSTETLQPGQTKANSTLSPQTTSAGPMLPPSTFSGTNSTQIVRVQQNGSGNGLYAQTTSTAGSGVVAIATNPSGGLGVYGQSASFAGLFGNAVATSGFVNGVFGLTSSTDGAGVGGTNNATTGFATGVTGNSASTNGNGVFGNATATSGYTNGVFGQTASPFGTGVFGVATSPNGQAGGVGGQTVNWVGVGGQATATSGSPAYGVWGDSLSTDGVGVAGYADATSGNANGVLGVSVSPNGSGMIGVNNATTGPCNQSFCNGGIGVQGIASGTNGNAYGVSGSTATTGFGAGVIGGASATTGQAFGVFGQTNSPNGPAIFGNAASTSGYPSAVVGFLDSNDGGVAGQFIAHTGAGLILQGLSGPNFNQVFSVDANGNLNISGNLVVTGTKSSTAKLQNGREVALYAVESPENWFEDFGSAELKSGVALVPLDASFAEATNASIAYHVFLTANGDSNGLYVSRKTATGFEVREHGAGSSNVAFDYRIVVKRRGFEGARMAEVQHDVKTLDSSRQHLAKLVNSGSLRRPTAPKVPQTVLPHAIRPVAQRPSVPKQPQSTIPQVPRVAK
jgi:hypothetical protein